MDMNGNMSPQSEIPDKLLTQFNKRPEDKPFSYLPTGGMQELQQRTSQRPAPARRQTSQQSVGSSGLGRQSSVQSNTSDGSHDRSGLFTPAYLNYIQQQQQAAESAYYKPDSGYAGPGQNDDVKAFVLNPDGTMAAIKLNDPSYSSNNTAVLSALLEEQQAREHGYTTGRIKGTNAEGRKNVTLPYGTLKWLTDNQVSDQPSFDPTQHTRIVGDAAITDL